MIRAELLARCGCLGISLLTQARLHALGVLGATDLSAKLTKANAALQLTEEWARLVDFTSRYFQAPPTRGVWSTVTLAEVQRALSCRDIAESTLARALDEAKHTTLCVITRLQREAAASPFCSHIVGFLNSLQRTLRLEPATAEVDDGDVFQHFRNPPRTVKRVLRGPTQQQLDSIFSASYSAVSEPMPAFGLTPREFVPYFWTVSIQEATAAALCALNLVEYDGLPLDFYRDMAKQCADESRHAVAYLNLALELMPEMQDVNLQSQALRIGIDQFMKTGRGLPIPIERGFYEAIWNADLTQRLILLHHDTEERAVPRLRKYLRTVGVSDYPSIRQAFEMDAFDEASHAGIGRRWLKFLQPNAAERDAAIADTRLLRGILMLTAVSHHSSIPLGDLIAKFSLES